jgi:hypothetical protein
MGDLTGYGLNTGSWRDAQEFAESMLGLCDLAADGVTWEYLRSDDIAMGAPPDAAHDMNAYLEEVFCPAARPIGQ